MLLLPLSHQQLPRLHVLQGRPKRKRLRINSDRVRRKGRLCRHCVLRAAPATILCLAALRRDLTRAQGSRLRLRENLRGDVCLRLRMGHQLDHCVARCQRAVCGRWLRVQRQGEGRFSGARTAAAPIMHSIRLHRAESFASTLADYQFDVHLSHKITPLPPVENFPTGP
eukprot:SAG31_NODE_469_length_15244_cov_11.537141_20_plen_169_part_00